MAGYKKLLLEIPIYSMREQDFNKRWRNFKNRIRVKTSQTDAEFSQMIHDLYYPQNVWKYNQIIGYITISAGINEIIIEEYQTLDKRFYAVSKTKHWIQNLCINGSGIYVGNQNNDEIKFEIRKRFEFINQKYRKYFIDYSVYDNLIKYIDFKNILNDIEKEVGKA